MIILFLAGWLARRGLSAAFANFLAPVIVYGVIGLAAWFGGPWLWNRYVAEPYRQEGRVEVQAKWDDAIKAEAERIAKAVAEAQAEAQKTIDALEANEERLNAELEKARAEADNDPRANELGLTVDSVRRLNRIR